MLLKLFFSFLKIGLFSVGGGYAAIPLIQNQIVDVHKLMTLAEFTDLITVAEMTPGPISINSATFVGTRLAGTFGAIVCSVGVVIPSLFICLTLAFFYYKYRKISGVQTVLGALRPAIVALIASAGAAILILGLFNTSKNSIILSDFRYIEFGIFIISFYLLRKFKLNAISVIFGSGALGTIIYLAI